VRYIYRYGCESDSGFYRRRYPSVYHVREISAKFLIGRGTKFNSFAEYHVIFDNEEVVANYINSTLLWVYSPKHAAGIYQLKVTADNVNYVTLNKDFHFQSNSLGIAQKLMYR
jgi:hypothetical protein